MTIEQLLECSIDGILLTSTDGKIQSANSAACTMLGRSEDEIRSLGRQGLVDPSDPNLQHMLAERQRSGKVRGQLDFLRPDGTHLPCEISSSVYRDADGKTLTITILRDVTERQRAEKRFQNLLESAPDAMVIVDASGRIVLVNLQVEMLFGYSRSELLGNTVEMLVPERFRARHTMHRGEYLQSPQVRPMGWRLNSLYGLHKNGTEFPIEVSLSPLQTEEGVLVASAIRNISKRLVMEQALERERARLEIILSTVNDGIHIIRDDGVLVEANHAFLSMLGYDNTAIGHLRVDQWHGQDTWEVIHERMTRIIQSKKLIVFPTVYRRKDGSRLQVEISACPVGIDEQQFICASSRDITERAALMHQLKELNESLEEHVRKRTEELAIANRDLESFTYSVSHDLRAPVRAMASYARIVDENESGHLSPRGHDMLERIRVNAGRLGELIDDMLQFSRIGRYQLSFQIVNMAALARAVVDDLRSDYPRAEIVVGNMPEVRGDASMLRQVWTNLIGNALKFSSKSERPLVTIGSNNLHDQPEFFVQDNGAGFDMEFAHKLFEVFQRLHTEKEFPGTGVGLAIVKRIIERHGGKVWAHGEPNMGAIFRFTIGN